jgi:hypothetical protein
MSFEQPNNNFELPNPPSEINVPEMELQTNNEGKHYQYEKDGMYYGGEYLPEPPQEIDITFPSAPPETPSIVI